MPAARDEGPTDLRLVGPALAAWGAAALALTAPAGQTLAGVTGGLVLAGGLLVVAARGSRRGLGLTALAAVLLSAVAGGAAGGLRAADARAGPVPGLAREHARVSVELTVTSDPRRPRNGPPAVLLDAELTEVDLGGVGSGAPAGSGTPAGPGLAHGRVGTHTPVLVMARHRAWAGLLPSTRVRVTGRLAPARDTGERAVAVLRVGTAVPPDVIAGPSAVQRAAGALRDGLREATRALPADARALLPGLVVGDTSRVPADLYEAFRRTDLVHLLAVSGSNLTVVLFLLIGPAGRASLAERGGLAPRLGLSLRATAVCGAALTLGFVLVCRPDPSVLRAAACGAVVLLAIATGRRRSLVPALAAAVLLLVLWDPWLARSYGFLLSVLATGALLTLGPRWSEALQRRRVPARLAEAVAAAAAAQAVCAPVVVVLAARVSLVAVPCNLLAELAAAPATVLGFAALAVAPVAMPVAELVARCAAVPADWIAAVARTGASLPGAELAWPGGAAGGALLAMVTLITGAAVARWHGPEPPGPPDRSDRSGELRELRGSGGSGRSDQAVPPAPSAPGGSRGGGRGRSRWARGLLSAAAVLALVLAVLRPVPLTRVLTGWPPEDWRYVQCSVGQGDAGVLAAGPGTAVVVDAGPDPGPVDRCLTELSITRVPLLMLTHFHADHVGGLAGVLDGRVVGAIQATGYEEPAEQAAFVRRTAAAARIPVLTGSAGEHRRVGAVEWQVLWPPSGAPPPAGGPNDASVVVLARTAGLSLLLLGDLEPAAQEELLTTHPELGPVDVLKVAHHGSVHQSPALIRRVRPRLALVPVGAANRYGHPAPATLDLLRSTGATVVRTDTDGPLAVLGDRAALQVARGGG
ncbi:ComEC/Rec2 family competence protein [Streptomyces sp. NPDC093225]|uniref:ComEC/Rec2 family competence protein n=1 Tax=Streptomyces sp. NPDC093225 TaxID=3366034 RepID=UPI003809A594